MLTKVSPFLLKKLEISSNCFSVFISKVTSLIGLLINSDKDPIFWILSLLNLFWSSEVDLITFNINEFPSFKISRFKSNKSEKINNSNTLDKSVSFKIA